MDQVERTQKKALMLSSSEEVTSILQKSTNFLMELINSNGDTERMQLAVASLEEERNLVLKSDHEMDSPLREFSYRLSETLESTMKWLIRKEIGREEEIQDEDSLISESGNDVGGYVRVAPTVKNIKLEESDALRSDSNQESVCYSPSADEFDSNEEMMDGSDPESSEDEQLTKESKKGMSKKRNSEKKASNGKFKCSECKRMFRRIIDLKNHMSFHKPQGKVDSDLPFKCEICGKGFSQSSNRYTHQLKHFPDDNSKFPFGCDQCDKRYRILESLEKHKKFHSADYDPITKSYKCDICGKFIAKGSYGLKQHKKTHLNLRNPEEAKIRRPFECQICQKRLTQQQFRMHMEIHTKAPEERKRFECKVCGKRFYQTGHLNEHARTHNPDYDPSKGRIVCPICGKDYSGKIGIQMHMLTHEDVLEKQRPFVCDECGQRFTQKSCVNVHKKYKHPPGGVAIRQLVECEFCGKKCAHKSDLQMHINSQHVEGAEIERPFECKDCGIRFRRKEHLKGHRKRRHQADLHDRSETYPCRTCGKEFKHEYQYNFHQLTHQKGIENQRPFKCDDCGKRFARICDLTYHRNTQHPGASKVKLPFACDMCDSSFMNPNSLSKHKWKHSRATAESGSKMKTKKAVQRKNNFEGSSSEEESAESDVNNSPGIDEKEEQN